MIEFAETFRSVDVEPGEYNRLLGYPRGWVLNGRARELADRARDWYGRHGRPWVHVREAASLELTERSFRIEATAFSSERFRRALLAAEAHRVVLAVISAGPELEQETSQLWSNEKPDECFFLDAFGSAVVERLAAMTGARLRACVQGDHLAVLPHYSPGYSDWDLSEQKSLFELINAHIPSCPVEALDSGALRPKKSLLAVFGIAPLAARVRQVNDEVPCENCSLNSCDYRRTPLDPQPRYAVNQKALKRWAAERLCIEPQRDESIRVRFRYDGTTCTDMGRALAFDYFVELGPREEGYPIREQHCSPAGDGHTFMCQYLKVGLPLVAAIDAEKPLLGRPLNDVLDWQRSSFASGCYCDPGGREHKWGLVLETIHYALSERERHAR
jgi:hypothetical protein